MKNILKKLIAAVFALVLAIGCDISDFGDTNLNPAATNEPITSALLTNVLSAMGGYVAVGRPALYCQYCSETQYSDASCYSSNQADLPGYAGVLYDLENIIIYNTGETTKAKAALNGSNNNQIAIARILKQYIFWTITDRWGDIPYTTALKGDPKLLTYDTQEAVYKGMISELKAAVAQFDAGSTVKGDVAYNGDNAKWKKLANSLRMLMALRLSKVYPGATDYAATEFKAALADGAGSIETNADNFMLNYPGGNFSHPWYNTYNGRKDFGESKTMTDMLGAFGDGRQSVFGSTVLGGASTKGVPYGWARAKVEAWTAANSDWAYVFPPSLRQQTSSLVIVGASPVLLARAEAADRGWTTENVTTRYEAGIKASFAQWSLAEPSSAYLSQTGVALTASAGTAGNLKQIATQRYIAMYPDGIQGWSEWRRTGHPVLTPAPDATNSSKAIPRRYTYGTNDLVLTKDEITKAIARINGGDTMDGRVWWDK